MWVVDGRKLTPLCESGMLMLQAVCCRMIFGFRAMDNLKAHTISYSVTKGAYDKYFNSLSGDWNAAYVSNDEDTTESNKVIIMAAAVMLSPLVFLAIKILSDR